MYMMINITYIVLIRCILGQTINNSTFIPISDTCMHHRYFCGGQGLSSRNPPLRDIQFFMWYYYISSMNHVIILNVPCDHFIILSVSCGRESHYHRVYSYLMERWRVWKEKRSSSRTSTRWQRKIDQISTTQSQHVVTTNQKKWWGEFHPDTIHFDHDDHKWSSRPHEHLYSGCHPNLCSKQKSFNTINREVSDRTSKVYEVCTQKFNVITAQNDPPTNQLRKRWNLRISDANLWSRLENSNSLNQSINDYMFRFTECLILYWIFKIFHWI